MYTVWACGSNGGGQLGTGDLEDRNQLQRIAIASASKPVKFAFGGNHTLVLMEDGAVFACGANTHRQCGVPHETRTFAQVPGHWADIAAGWEYSLFLAANGDLYSAGHGPKGELGTGARSQSLSKVGSGFVSVKLLISHVIARKKDGLYGWGSCRRGQLGDLEGSPKAVWTPQRLSIACSDYAMGHDRTVLVGPDIRVIGRGAATVAANAHTVRAMWSSVHYETGDRIHSFGNDTHGQLLRLDPGPVTAWDVGSEHGLLIADNKVYAWGWGEHGNCGPGNKVTYDGLHELKCDGRPQMVAGGLATSWVVTTE